MSRLKLVLEHEGQRIMDVAFLGGDRERDEALHAIAHAACRKGLPVGQVCVELFEENYGILTFRVAFPVHELMPFWEQAVVLLAREEGGLLDDTAERAAKAS